IEPLRYEDGVATAEGEEMLARSREAVAPVLTVPIRNEDVAVECLDGVGRHVERLAIGTRMPLDPKRQQYLAGGRVFRDSVQAGVGQVNGGGRVDADPMRRGRQVPPTANLVPVPVEHQDVPNAA